MQETISWFLRCQPQSFPAWFITCEKHLEGIARHSLSVLMLRREQVLTQRKEQELVKEQIRKPLRNKREETNYYVWRSIVCTHVRRQHSLTLDQHKEENENDDILWYVIFLAEHFYWERFSRLQSDKSHVKLGTELYDSNISFILHRDLYASNDSHQIMIWSWHFY